MGILSIALALSALHIALATAQDFDCIPADLYPLLYAGDSFSDACAGHSTREIVNWQDGEAGTYPEIETCNCYPISGMDRDGTPFFRVTNVTLVGTSVYEYSRLVIHGDSPIPGDRALYEGHNPKSFAIHYTFRMHEPVTSVNAFGLTFSLIMDGASRFTLRVTAPQVKKIDFLGAFADEVTTTSWNVEDNALPLSVGGLWMTRQENMAMAVYTHTCEEAGSDHLVWMSGGEFVPENPTAQQPSVIRLWLTLEVCYENPLPGMTVPSSWRDGAFMLARSTQQLQTFRDNVSEHDEGGVSTDLVAAVVGGALLVVCSCLSVTVFFLILRRRQRDGSVKGRARSVASVSSRYHAPSRQASRSRVAVGA
jgi:hypothetical protein